MYAWATTIPLIILFVYTRYASYDMRVLLGAFASTILGQTLLAVAQTAAGHSIGGPLWYLGERSFTAQTPEISTAAVCIYANCVELLRGYGTFAHPNILAGYGLMLLATNLVIVRQSKMFTPKLARFVTILITTISLAAISVSFSRLGIALSITYLLIFFRSYIRNTALVAFIAFVTTLIVLVVIPLSATPGSINERVALMLTGVNQSTLKIVGVGYGAYLRHIGYGMRVGQTYLYQPVHNIYVLFFVEFGLSGVLFVGYLLWRMWIDIVAFIKTTYILPPIGLLIIGLFDHYPLTLQQGQLLFAFTLGICLALFKNYPSQRSSNA